MLNSFLQSSDSCKPVAILTNFHTIFLCQTVKQELSYVQRRIEDDIATRKKITIERDEFCCQVAELQDA